MISLTDIGWLAGILEGEGCFTEAGPSARVGVKMTDYDILLRLKTITGVGTICGPYIPAINNLGKKPYWTWRVSKQADVGALMMMVFPLMGERRRDRIEGLLKAWRRATDPPTHCRNGIHPKAGRGRCAPCFDARTQCNNRLATVRRRAAA